MGKFRHAFLVTLAAVLILSALASNAAVKPNALFTDGAVLQQGMRVPVWGTAADGEKITISIQCQTVATTAMGGYWITYLKPLKAGGPYTMKINDIELKNIMVGEVWVCGGQSNMAWPLKSASNGPEAVAASTDPQLRLFSVRRTDKVSEPIDATWQEASPETVPDFSAVGYFFGRDLRRDLKVPVGLINCNVGATPAEAWMSREVLKRGFSHMFVKPPRIGKARPTGLYNAMLAPIIPYGIKGAIWYQGEGNADRPEEYRSLFPTMIQNWRDDWRQGDFPFLFVQLAPFAPKDRDFAGTREAQLLTLKTVPNTAMAVITDIGEETDIHPKQKEPVGARLALAARAIAYGQDIVYSGPIYKAFKVEADKVIVSFDHTGSGLVAADGGVMLTGFTIAGSDGRFVPAKAEIRRGRGVVVSSPEVPNPVAVRYGYSNWMTVNLFNKEGLPASPFRTDGPEAK